MAKSRSKKKYRKKKNPNRKPQAQNRAVSAQGAKVGDVMTDPNRRKQLWIAVGIAAAVFILLIAVSALSGRGNDAQDAAADAATEQSADADSVAEDETSGTDADSDAATSETDNTDSDAATSADSNSETATSDADNADSDAATSDADSGNSDAATSADSGNSVAATSTTSNADSNTATSDADTASSDAATSADSGNSNTATSDTSNASSNTAANTADDDTVKAAAQVAEIVVKDYGSITVELDATAAPKTVENFVKLANDKFYDGLTFHRIMDGFMIQGGDPQGNGFGGSDENIVGEFESNGYNNPISHTRGTISMARAGGDNNSASSQFFIVQTDSAFLDGDYAAFGHVTSGMDVVDKICEDAKPIDDNGTIPAEEQPVIESITIREA